MITVKIDHNHADLVFLGTEAKQVEWKTYGIAQLFGLYYKSNCVPSLFFTTSIISVQAVIG